MRHTLAIVALAVAPTLGPSAARCQTTFIDSSVPLTLPGSHLHTVKSKVNGRTYVVAVVVPEAYVGNGPSDTTRYPMFYVTDAQVWLPVLVGLRKLAALPGRSPEPAADPILVGIWEGAGRDLSYTPALTRDTATKNERLPDGSPKYGGAAAFLRVLKEEIFPLVDRLYRTSGDRGIYGHSFGGLFATYVLFEEPDLFTRYAITSPGLWWDNYAYLNGILSREPSFAKAHPSLPKTIYLSVGSEENSMMNSVLWRLMGQICDSADDLGSYKGLRILAETIPGDPHASPVSLWRALQTLYWPPGRGVPQPRDVKTC